MSLIPFAFWSTSNTPVLTNLLFYYDPGNTSSYPGSGTTVTDLSSNNYGGTLNGATYSSGNGGVFTFDGVNDGITINSAITTSMYSSSFSICMFVRPSVTPPGTQSFASFLNDGDSTQRRLKMRVFSDGAMQMSYFANDLSTASSLITFGNWYYIVMQYDLATDTSRIWQNVVERASGNPGPFLSGPASRAFIGNSDNSSEWWKGDIGVMMGYTKNLTSSEMTENFNFFKSRYNL